MRSQMIIALGASLFALATSCSSSDDSNNGEATKNIGAEGGRLSGPDGAGLDIPQGALESEISFAISKVQSGYPEMPNDVSVQSDVFAFLPHGQAFNQPVTVSVPFSEADPPGLSLMTAQPDGQWSVVPEAAVSGKAMQAKVSHLSFFAVTRSSVAHDSGSDAGVDEGVDLSDAIVNSTPLNGNWKIESCTCDGNPKDLGSGQLTMYFSGYDLTIKNKMGDCTMTVKGTVVYPAKNQVEWTLKEVSCEPKDCLSSCGQTLNSKHTATYRTDGSSLTVTEEKTPPDEYGCESKKQVCNLTWWP